MSAIDAFPKRPLELTGYNEPIGVLWGIFLFSIGCLFYIGLPIALYRSGVYLVDDYRLHNSGLVANYIHTDHVRASAKSASFEFELSYTTQDGRAFTRHVGFFPIFYPPNRSDGLTVRYDPASPQHFSTSWGVQRLPSRTLMFVIEGVVLLVLYRGLIADLLGIPADRRRKRALAAVAAQHVPIAATLVKAGTLERAKAVNIDYSWNDPSGQTQTGRRKYPRDQEPFWLDPAKTQILALISPDPTNSNIILLNETLSWVSLTDQERTQLRATRDQTNANQATQDQAQTTHPSPVIPAPEKPAPAATAAPAPQTPPRNPAPPTEQMCDDQTRDLVRGLNFAADPYLWGYHWGRPFDGGAAITQVEFGEDLLRIHFANSATSQEILSVWSPRGISVTTLPGGVLRSGKFEIREAQRVRWEWIFTSQPPSCSYLEFWRIDGDIYGKSNAAWAPNTGTGLGDQSLPAVSLSI